MQTLYVCGVKESLHPWYITYIRAADLRKRGRRFTMSPRLDRYGDPIEDDVYQEIVTRPSGRRPTVRQRCDELRRIIREARANREAGQ